MSAATFTALLLGALLVLTVVADWRDWRPNLALTLVGALVLRVVVAVLARGHTLHDVMVYFHSTATLVSHGQDPVTKLPRYQWNFLPVMPYAYAALVHLKLSWETTVKILPIAADCVNVGLVFLLAPRRALLRAFQYAMNPVAVLVTSWHGQVEPVALCFGLLGLVMLNRKRDVPGALSIGFAIAIKTWPVVFAVSILRARPPRRWLQLLALVAAVPFVIFVTMPLYMHVNLRETLRRIAGYRSFVGNWGWSGVLQHTRYPKGFGYAGNSVIDREQRIGTLLTILAFVAVIWLWRRARPEILVLSLLYATLCVAAGWGIQYLLWPVPLALAFATRRTHVFVVVASLFTMDFYLRATHRPGEIPYLSLLVIAAIIVSLPFDQRVAPTAAVESEGALAREA